jgi:hypothetical protein
MNVCLTLVRSCTPGLVVAGPMYLLKRTVGRLAGLSLLVHESVTPEPCRLPVGFAIGPHHKPAEAQLPKDQPDEFSLEKLRRQYPVYDRSRRAHRHVR